MKRVKWYHFYIVLASFDVFIILAGLWLYRKTFTTFIEWRNHIGVSDARQGHLSLLLKEVLILNAPGNDVFRTHRVDEESARYRNRRDRITAMRSRGPMPAADLADFWNEVDAMCQEASQLFASLPHGTASAPAAGERLTARGTVPRFAFRRNEAMVRAESPAPRGVAQFG